MVLININRNSKPFSASASAYKSWDFIDVYGQDLQGKQYQEGIFTIREPALKNCLSLPQKGH